MSEEINRSAVEPLKRIGTLLAYLLTGWVGIILILSLILGITPGEFFAKARDSLILNIIYLVALYGLILIITHFKLKQDGKKGLIDLGFKVRNGEAGKILPAVLWTGAVFIFYLFLLNLFNVYSIKPIKPELLIFEITRALFLGFLFALVEEIFFRGYIFQTMLEKYPLILSIIATNAFFAVLHIFRPGTPLFKSIYFLGIFTVGAALSYLFYLSGNLLLPIGVHSVWVAIMYLIPILLVPDDGNYTRHEIFWGLDKTPVAGVMGIILIAITVLIIKRFYQKQVENHSDSSPQQE